MQLLYQLMRFDSFIEDETHSQLAQFDFLRSVGKCGENYNGRVGNLGAELSNSIQAHPISHHGVNENNLWVGGGGARDRRSTVIGETYDGKICFAIQSRQNLCTDLEMIVGDDNGNAFHRGRV